MEDYVGRKLKRNEKVHHIDLDKANNGIENLYLCKSPSEHLLLHRQLESIGAKLVKSGFVKFLDGKYYIK